MNRIFQLTILALTLLTEACLFSHTTGGTYPDRSSQKAEKERILFLIRGNACQQICGEKDTSPICKPGPETCKSWAPGWYPVEFARDEKYFDFSEYYPKKKRKVIMNIPTNLLKKYDASADDFFEYKPVQSVPELAQEFPKGVFKNVLIIKLADYERTSNWTSYIPYFTLLVVPGYVEESFKTEISRFDSSGKEIKISQDENSPKLKHWFGWVFFLWGPMFSSNDKHLLYRTIETLPAKSN